MNNMVDSISKFGIRPSDGLPLTSAPAPAQIASFFERMKHYLNPKNLMETISSSKDKIIEMGMYLGIGFLAGFLLKKYSKYIIILLVCVGALVVLQQFEIVTVVFNTAKIEEVFGIKTSTMDSDLFSVYWHWIKLNFSIVLSFSIGFLLGLKVG